MAEEPNSIYDLFTGPLQFGGCGCGGIIAAYGTVVQPYFGWQPFTFEGRACPSKFLVFTRTLVSASPPELVDASFINYYIGSIIKNRYTGTETFGGGDDYVFHPQNWTETVKHNVSYSSRNIILVRNYYDINGYPQTGTIVMLETLTDEYSALDLKDYITDKTVNDIPWESEQYYRQYLPTATPPGYYYKGSSWFTLSDGSIAINTNFSPNPVTLGYSCDELAIANHFIGYTGVGDEYIQGQGAFTALKREYNTKVQKYASQRVYLDLETIPLAPWLCNDVRSWCTPVGDPEIIPARQLILPPSQAEMASWGIPVGTWGVTQTVSC